MNDRRDTATKPDSAYERALERANDAAERQMVRDAWFNGHRGQHELEMCSGCRVVVMGPQYWDFD